MKSKLILPVLTLSLTTPLVTSAKNLWTPDAPTNTYRPAVLSLSSKISDILQEAQTLSLGKKVYHFQTKSQEIVSSTNLGIYDEIPVMIIDRTLQISKEVITHSGNNHELVSQWMANFYLKSFELALAYSNNPRALCRERSKYSDQWQSGIPLISIAEVGYYYQTLLLRSQSGLISDSTKGVILLTMLKYMYSDLSNDLRRREEGINQILNKIEEIWASSQSYKGVEKSLLSGYEPQQNELNALRGQVYNLWTRLPEALRSSGLSIRD